MNPKPKMCVVYRKISLWQGIIYLVVRRHNSMNAWGNSVHPEIRPAFSCEESEKLSGGSLASLVVKKSDWPVLNVMKV